jgi:hypothetical protein
VRVAWQQDQAGSMAGGSMRNVPQRRNVSCRGTVNPLLASGHVSTKSCVPADPTSLASSVDLAVFLHPHHGCLAVTGAAGT